ncbi:MAG TPA: NAD-dependent deacylase [Thermoanaerobaculia bacterium]
MDLDQSIASLAARWSARARWTVVTGAGVSAASGIPTFRGKDGLWKSYRAEELATPEAFRKDPRTVWEWYDWRRQLIAAARPNRAHEVLADWSRRQAGFTLITQNVDGLHERAGTLSVIRFHGSIWELQCLESCRGPAHRWDDARVPLPEVPRCPDCSGSARPGVVWFGEPIDPDTLRRSDRALDCDVCLVVGTSSVVYPAAGLAAVARERGAYTVEINPEPGSSDVDLVIAGKAEEVLEQIDRAID